MLLQMMEKHFDFLQRRTTWHQELISAVSTFFAMAYIIVVNPAILSGAGMDNGAIFTATCLSAALGCFLMGLIANYPIALAPSMGLNAYFSYVIVQKMHFSWQVALSAVFIAGVLFFLLSYTRFRQRLIQLIPSSLKMGIICGIGLFIGVVGLKNLGLVSINSTLAFHFNSQTLNIQCVLCLFSLCLIVILNYFRVAGSILFAMLAATLIGCLFHITHLQTFFSKPPSLSPSLFQLQFTEFTNLKFIWICLVFLWVSLFDNTGTLMALLHQAKLMKNDEVPNLKQALMADSLATIAGSLMGTSSTGSYIESAVGVNSGGRTGVMSIMVGILFLLSLYFSPLAASIPVYATSAALLYVSWLMLQQVCQISWVDISEWLPALVTLLAIPFFFSIADGIALGLLCYFIFWGMKKNRRAD